MNRILVVATRQIGDVFLTTPLIRAVRQRWPDARIEVLGFQGTLGMLAGNPDVDELLETPPRLGVRGALQWTRRLWRRYDLALVTDAGDRAHLLGWIASRCRSGVVPGEGGSSWWKRRALRHAVDAAGDRGAVHVVNEKLALLAPWTGPTPELAVVPPAAASLPDDLQSALQPGAVVVHAPSMWNYKQWPLEHYVEVVRALLAQGRQVVLTGSGSARDQACIAPLRSVGTSPQLLDTSGRLSFRQLVTLFRRASLYIGPDTSVSHLAAASGIPVIALFGPTNPMRWAPWPSEGPQPIHWQRSAQRQQVGNVRVLQAGLSCVPCGRAGCEDRRDSDSRCLPAIGPDRVLAEAAAVLGH